MTTPPSHRDLSGWVTSKTVAAVSATVTVLLIASLMLFFRQPDHRVGGVAWNALFQIFAPFFTLLYTAGVALLVFGKAVDPRAGIPAALIPGAIAAYCIYRTFPALMSV